MTKKPKEPLVPLDQLLTELSDDDVIVRRRSALELGQHGATKGGGAQNALIEALTSADTKLRKNAAIALGKMKAVGAAQAIYDAALREEINWARPSMLLALGALGDVTAQKLLDSFEPRTAKDEEALRRAKGQDETIPCDAAFIAAPGEKTLFSVPVGLERVAMDECAENGIIVTKSAPGFLRVNRAITTLPLASLRCVYETFAILAETDRPHHTTVSDWPADTLEELTKDLIHRAESLRHKNEWLKNSDPLLRFRFFINLGKVRRERLRAIAQLVHALLGPYHYENNPSAYAIELGLVAVGNRVALALKPSFLSDDRFDYRLRDVGASINPVVAAALARLLGTSTGDVILDPTCGSGTVLVERGKIDPSAPLVGIDISPTAIKAATVNRKAAGLESRMTLIKGDGANPENWPSTVGRVAANLPFGMRAKGNEPGLRTTYEGVVRNCRRFLSPAGVALLYSCNGKLLDGALRKEWSHAKVESLQTRSGGLSVMVRLVRRK